MYFQLNDIERLVIMVQVRHVTALASLCYPINGLNTFSTDYDEESMLFGWQMYIWRSSGLDTSIHAWEISRVLGLSSPKYLSSKRMRSSVRPWNIDAFVAL